MDYDIAVIGNDEAAFEMMCISRVARRRTIAILPETRHSTWFFGQALRRLIADLLADDTRERRQLLRRVASPKLLRSLLARAVAAETRDHIQLLRKLGIDVLLGETRFTKSRELAVSLGASCSRRSVNARNVVIGTGVRQTSLNRATGLIPFHRPEVLFQGLNLPKTAFIVGGGEFGAGLAAVISLMGVNTSLIARDDGTSVMLELARSAGVITGRHPSEVGLPSFGEAFTEIHAGVIDCRRSVGFTNHLNLNRIGVEPDENGKLWCAGNLETWCGGVFGIGDVVGFSADTAVHPSLQAQRIMNHLTDAIPRPHFLGRSADVRNRMKPSARVPATGS